MRDGKDTVKRPKGCQCQWELGDSPCRVHDYSAGHVFGECHCGAYHEERDEDALKGEG